MINSQTILENRKKYEKPKKISRYAKENTNFKFQ